MTSDDVRVRIGRILCDICEIKQGELPPEAVEHLRKTQLQVTVLYQALNDACLGKEWRSKCLYTD